MTELEAKFAKFVDETGKDIDKALCYIIVRGIQEKNIDPEVVIKFIRSFVRVTKRTEELTGGLVK